MSAPLNRRAAIGRIASAAALALPAGAAAAAACEPDLEIIALSDEIVRRCAEAELFQQTRIDPFEDRFQSLGRSRSKSQAVSWDEAFAFSRESGRDAAISELAAFDEATDRMFDRMMAIRATAQTGRAAKVRALLAHVMRDGWRGPAKEMNWDREQARALLGEFARLSVEELEAI